MPQGGPGNSRELGRIALDSARRTFANANEDVELQLVDRVADLPEGAPTLRAGDVLVAGLSDDPHERQIRWYKREGDKLVFTPTAKQYK